MKKLNQRKVRWIVREMDKGERSVYRIAKTMDVTPRWARQDLQHPTGEKTIKILRFLHYLEFYQSNLMT